MPEQEQKITSRESSETGEVKQRSLTGSAFVQLAQTVTENPTVAGVTAGVVTAKVTHMLSKPKDPPPAPSSSADPPAA